LGTQPYGRTKPKMGGYWAKMEHKGSIVCTHRAPILEGLRFPTAKCGSTLAAHVSAGILDGVVVQTLPDLLRLITQAEGTPCPALPPAAVHLFVVLVQQPYRGVAHFVNQSFAHLPPGIQHLDAQEYSTALAGHWLKNPCGGVKLFGPFDREIVGKSVGEDLLVVVLEKPSEFLRIANRNNLGFRFVDTSG